MPGCCVRRRKSVTRGCISPTGGAPLRDVARSPGAHDHRFPVVRSLKPMDKRLDTGGSCHLLDDSIERSSDVRVIAAKRPDLVASFNASGHVLVEPRLIEALLRHLYTENTREPHRILEVAICSSPGSFLALTRAVEAEMAGQRASGTATQSRRPCPVARGFALFAHDHAMSWTTCPPGPQTLPQR